MRFFIIYLGIHVLEFLKKGDGNVFDVLLLISVALISGVLVNSWGLVFLFDLLKVIFEQPI